MVVRLSLTMRIIDPLVIGGVAGIHADIEPIKTENAVLIPGTSIKGVLRTIAEGQCLCSTETVTKLFGDEGVAGVMRISSVLFGLDTVVHTKVSIDPLSGKARRGALYSVEFLKPCSAGDFTIEVYEDDEKLINCLLASLSGLRIYGLGRGRARVDVRVNQGVRNELLGKYGLSDWLWKDEWVSICGQP